MFSVQRVVPVWDGMGECGNFSWADGASFTSPLRPGTGGLPLDRRAVEKNGLGARSAMSLGQPRPRPSLPSLRSQRYALASAVRHRRWGARGVCGEVAYPSLVGGLDRGYLPRSAEKLSTRRFRYGNAIPSRVAEIRAHGKNWQTALKSRPANGKP